MTEKLRRKAEKEAKKKAEEIASLREEIKAKYVDKVTPVEEILKQEVTDIDGWSQDGKPVVSAIGGWLGQLMIVLNTVAKYYPQLDRPVKTGRSGGSRPKSHASKGSEGAKSDRSAGQKSEGASSQVPRKILNPQVVQNFIYVYILEKLKSEKLSMLVDSRYEKYLNNLPNPLQINEMRTMKEEKYTELRTLISNFMGSPILRLIKENQEALDMDPEVFDLVYQGFWDLYTFRPQIRDVSARKLQIWIQKIKLTAGPDRTPPPAEEAGEGDGDEEAKEEDGEEKPKKQGNEIDMDAEDKIDPVSAVIRVKIPKVPREPE